MSKINIADEFFLHQASLTKFLIKIVRNKEIASELMQDTFLKAYEKIDQFNGESTFKSWLYAIGRNEALNYLRKNKVIARHLDTNDASYNHNEETSLLIASVKEHIEALPTIQRNTMKLSIDSKDYSLVDIALMNKQPYDTVKANYRHALLKLKDTLNT